MRLLEVKGNSKSKSSFHFKDWCSVTLIGTGQFQSYMTYNDRTRKQRVLYSDIDRKKKTKA